MLTSPREYACVCFWNYQSTQNIGYEQSSFWPAGTSGWLIWYLVQWFVCSFCTLCQLIHWFIHLWGQFSTLRVRVSWTSASSSILLRDIDERNDDCIFWQYVELIFFLLEMVCSIGRWNWQLNKSLSGVNCNSVLIFC